LATHNIKLIRRTLLEVQQQATLHPQNFALIIDGEEVAVTYFRAGYAPEHYPSDQEWEGRLKIERSASIKCPSVNYHLSGCKKIQQVLADPSVLNKFFEKGEEQSVSRIHATFTGLYSLEEDSAVIQEALSNPHAFVLKPQREGGGNNLYDEELKTALENMTPQQRSAYVLMRRITPKHFPSVALRRGKIMQSDCVSELGIYSVVIGQQDRIIESKSGGYLLRTKFHQENEGGVAAGFSMLDSVYLS